MKIKIVNWIKTSLAVVIAIMLASVLRLEFAISAGIVAILTIQPTKKETVKTAWSRLVAFGVALLLAFVCFTLFGVTLQGFLAYVVCYILVCHLFGWNHAIAMNSVLVSHFVSFGAMEAAGLLNEILIFAIGVGTGIVANLHLHKRVNYMEELKTAADEQIVKILYRMSERIVSKDISDYNGDCFKILEQRIRKAKNLAEENYNNQFGNKDCFDMAYIAMREQQYLVLYEMYKDARKLESKPVTAEKIATFFADMADTFGRDNDGTSLMEQFQEMDRYMKAQPLPVTRQEFEDRATLFHLMREIEAFVHIKVEFSRRSCYCSQNGKGACSLNR